MKYIHSINTYISSKTFYSSQGCAFEQEGMSTNPVKFRMCLRLLDKLGMPAHRVANPSALSSESFGVLYSSLLRAFSKDDDWQGPLNPQCTRNYLLLSANNIVVSIK